jgi:2-phospho-L-lactate guanylyltransferase
MRRWRAAITAHARPTAGMLPPAILDRRRGHTRQQRRAWQDRVVRWQVMIPIRPAGAGKTRLRGATTDALHADLVRALQADALDAVLAARDSGVAGIAGVHLITDPFAHPHPGHDVGVLPDPGEGLNPALAAAAHVLRARSPGDAIAALVGDLPSLTGDAFTDVLAAATAVRRGFVIDHDGTGTTILTAAPGCALDPHFGPDSARSHQLSGAVPLPAAASARSDVDTPQDLQRCLRLGVGAHTSALVAHLL